MLRLVSAVLLALALTTVPAHAQKLISPSQFRDAVAGAIVRLEPRAAIEVTGELSLHVTAPPGANGEDEIDMTSNLDRGYEEYSWDPATLDDAVARWARFAVVPMEDVTAPDRLIGIMRTQGHIAGFAEMMQQADQPSMLVWRPVSGDVVEIMVFDGAEAVQFTTEASLADLNLTSDQAWALTPQNLPARLGPIDRSEIGEGVELFSGGNGLAPSVLLSPGFCAADDAGRFTYLLVDRDAYIRGDRRLQGDILVRVIRDGLVRDQQAFSTTILACTGGRLQEEHF